IELFDLILVRFSCRHTHTPDRVSSAFDRFRRVVLAFVLHLSDCALDNRVALHRLPRASDTFSREDVLREIRDSAFDSLHYCRVLIVPGLMMLAGGLLLGVTRRDKEQHVKMPSNQSIRPTVTWRFQKHFRRS